MHLMLTSVLFKRGQQDQKNEAQTVDELARWFTSACRFVHKHIGDAKYSNEWRTRTLLACMKHSLRWYIDTSLLFSDGGGDGGGSAIPLVDALLDLLGAPSRVALLHEHVALHGDVWTRAFAATDNTVTVGCSLKSVCTRVAMRLLERRAIECAGGHSAASCVLLQLDRVKSYVNLFLLLSHALDENRSNESDDKERTKEEEEDDNDNDEVETICVSEAFMPYMLEYIRLQEDQFVKYLHRMFQPEDALQRMIDEWRQRRPRRKISLGAALAAKRDDERGGEMCFWPSVLDLFTIMHELWTTVRTFTVSKNLGHLGEHWPRLVARFVDLVKLEMLAYLTALHNEHDKLLVTNAARSMVRSLLFSLTFSNFKINYRRIVDLVQ